MSKVSTPLKDLVVGDLIFTDVHIDKKDMPDPNATSGTANKIRMGRPVTRLAVVLVAGTSSVQVTYLATLAGSTQLPTTLTDKSMWYPISPATKESTYDPLPAFENNKAQWACLRKKQKITADPVDKVVESLSTDSADLILAAMKA